MFVTSESEAKGISSFVFFDIIWVSGIIVGFSVFLVDPGVYSFVVFLWFVLFQSVDDFCMDE